MESSTELLLWQWSSAVQISSTLLIALFFLVYGRSAQRPELRWWVAAWLANGAALSVTWAFWMLAPSGPALPLLLGVYFACKTSFVGLVLLGVIAFHRPERVRRILRPAAGAVLLLSGLGAIWVADINLIGVLQASIIALVLGAAAWECLRHPGAGLGWLALGCTMRAVLGLAEAVGYAFRLALPADALPESIGVFLAAHSSFDTGAEWVIALGCVLAITHRVHGEVVLAHAELGRAHESLRVVAERDALTGLYSRRMLKPLLEQHRDEDLELLFFDLDDFKRINDTQGHDVGDACLVRFADALRKHFSAARARVRFAGDEFIVIAPPGLAEHGTAALRADLARSAPGLPPLSTSVGRAPLPVGGSPDQALRDADLAMYREKASRPERRRD